MLGTSQRGSQGFVRGCLVPIISTLVVIAACYMMCSILFVLNGGELSFAAPTTPTPLLGTEPLPAPVETPTPSSFHQLPPSSVRFPITTNWR